MNNPTNEEIEDARTNARLDAAADKGEQCVYCGKDSWTCEHFEPPILDGSESEGE